MLVIAESQPPCRTVSDKCPSCRMYDEMSSQKRNNNTVAMLREKDSWYHSCSPHVSSEGPSPDHPDIWFPPPMLRFDVASSQLDTEFLVEYGNGPLVFHLHALSLHSCRVPSSVCRRGRWTGRISWRAGRVLRTAQAVQEEVSSA